MDPFKGNRKLESALYEGMDYALYSRHDLADTFMPFMMLHKEGKKKLIRVAYEGDPNIGFAETLNKEEIIYDQIIMCFEGRVPFENTKHDAIIVKGFDTSEPEGLLFIQRFQGIESGNKFKKLGRLSLASKTEKLPVQIHQRNNNKDIEEPYIYGLLVKEPNGLTAREIIAGHENGSLLANYLYQSVIGSLSKNENEFSGKFKFNFVPGTLAYSDFNKFIIEQIGRELLNDDIIEQWETRFKRKVVISYKFDGSEESIINPEVSSNETKLENRRAENHTSIAKEQKPWWKIW